MWIYSGMGAPGVCFSCFSLFCYGLSRQNSIITGFRKKMHESPAKSQENNRAQEETVRKSCKVEKVKQEKRIINS